MLSIQRLQNRSPAVAKQILGVLALASTAEAIAIGAAEPQHQLHHVSSSTHVYIGAFDSEVLVGVIAIGPDEDANQLQITMLVVLPAHQRQGVGAALVAHVVGAANGAVVAVVVAANNSSALALYKAADFLAYRHGTIGPQDVLVVKLRRAP